MKQRVDRIRIADQYTDPISAEINRLIVYEVKRTHVTIWLSW
ncbi:hypothetical protein [Vibrio rhizosphaerae]|uniref:Uncharacterized protein n=1 Tax=Vibrio rhizosphaerae TaxID=398736 RepID=A0ABU4ISJ7_9VIBR|nr:hypothetical protein [Vibrio rhizosphaerae]MDW6092097.1 hypothetical protein [Vibrio rhizosphaerae]